MSESWKDVKDLIPQEATAYVVCLDCGHPYTEALRTRPGPCPSCKSTTNRDQYDSLAVEAARAPELDPDDQMAYIAAIAAINDLPAPVVSVSQHTYVHGPPRINMATSLRDVRKTNDKDKLGR